LNIENWRFTSSLNGPLHPFLGSLGIAEKQDKLSQVKPRNSITHLSKYSMCFLGEIVTKLQHEIIVQKLLSLPCINCPTPRWYFDGCLFKLLIWQKKLRIWKFAPHMQESFFVSFF
jgi:hypothetical protein